jgi:hypothetical protein
MNQRKKKYKTLKIVVLILLISVALILAMRSCIETEDKDAEKSLAEMLPETYSLTHDDSNLINDKYLSKIKVDEVVNHKGRNSFSFLEIDKMYSLLIYKFDIKKDTSITTILQTQVNGLFGVHKSNGIWYYGGGNNSTGLDYEEGVVSPVSKIYLTLQGVQPKKIAINDSIICYHLLCKNFSIQYTLNAPVDILVSSDDPDYFFDGPLKYHFESMDILFLKRKKAVYLLVMTPYDAKKAIPDGITMEIIR